MKINLKKIFLVILLVLFMIPSFTFAVDCRDCGPDYDEDAGTAIDPNDYAYFLVYPNGVVEGYEHIDDINNPPELLIYEGVSNENGEIILGNLQTTGQLRIEQDTPHGYTAISNKILVDLAEKTTAGFVNYKGVINPATGRKALYLLILIAIIVLVVVTIKQKTELLSRKDLNKDENKKEKKSKKVKTSMFIILPLLFALFTMNISAKTKNFIITTKDSHGNALSNVTVRVYAKPIEVQRAPYIKFNANGGEFLDGKTEMLFRLPSASCSSTEFYNSLDDETRDYLYANRDGATREGYYIAGTHQSGDEQRKFVAKDELFVNGQVINTEWERNNEAHVVTIHGNGGYRKIGNKILTSYKMYESDIDISSSNEFTNDVSGEMFVGMDNNSNCSHYPYGISDGSREVFDDSYYVCWNRKPDGIYVNNVYYFKGNMDNCFSTSKPYSYEVDGDWFQLTGTYIGERISSSRGLTKHILKIIDAGKETISFIPFDSVYAADTPRGDSVRRVECDGDSCVQTREEITYIDFEKIEIVNHGNVIVTITSDDITMSDTNKKTILYVVSNTEKRSIVNNYLGSFMSKCDYDHPIIKDDEDVEKERESEREEKEAVSKR